MNPIQYLENEQIRKQEIVALEDPPVARALFGAVR